MHEDHDTGSGTPLPSPLSFIVHVHRPSLAQTRGKHGHDVHPAVCASPPVQHTTDTVTITEITALHWGSVGFAPYEVHKRPVGPCSALPTAPEGADALFPLLCVSGLASVYGDWSENN